MPTRPKNECAAVRKCLVASRFSAIASSIAGTRLPDGVESESIPVLHTMTTHDALTAALADRYRVEREIGAGGMATVFLAHDLKHDRRVALKVLHPDLAATIGV